MATAGAAEPRPLRDHAEFPRLVVEAATRQGGALLWERVEEDAGVDEGALSSRLGVGVVPGVPAGTVAAMWAERERQTCSTSRIPNDARRLISRTGGRSQSLSSHYSKGVTTPATTTAMTPWSSPRIPTGSSGSRRDTHISPV